MSTRRDKCKLRKPCLKLENSLNNLMANSKMPIAKFAKLNPQKTRDLLNYGISSNSKNLKRILKCFLVTHTEIHGYYKNIAGYGKPPSKRTEIYLH